MGIDATLDKIENFLTKHQWGTVYSFLINNQGETIFHPKLKPSTNVSTVEAFDFIGVNVFLGEKGTFQFVPHVQDLYKR